MAAETGRQNRVSNLCRIDRAGLVSSTGPANEPVRGVFVLLRHAVKGPEGISPDGYYDSVAVGMKLREAGVFRGIDRIIMAASPMPRSQQTSEGVRDGLGADNKILRSTVETPYLLGFGSAPGEGTFWGEEGKVFLARLAQFTANLTPKESDLLERPVITDWIEGKHPQLSALLDPRDAAADAALIVAAVLGSFSEVRPDGQPRVRRNYGAVGINHRGSFDPLYPTGVLFDLNGYPVTSLARVDGPSGLLAGSVMFVERHPSGEVSSEVAMFDPDQGLDWERFRIDIPTLNNFVSRGMERRAQRAAASV